jgi:hypothetical protein
MRCIAVDDEPLALQIIAEFASRISFLDLEKTFSDTDEAKLFAAGKRNRLNFFRYSNAGHNGDRIL